MAGDGPIISLDALAAEVPDGALLAVPPDYSGVAMAATRALIARGIKGLHLLAVPTSGLQAELLIGAGCVATVEAAAIALGEAGPAPRFTAAEKSAQFCTRIFCSTALYSSSGCAER